MKFKTEEESISYFVDRLKSKGWYDITSTQSLDKYSYYDVSATYNDIKVRFELKRRNKKHDEFGDSMCEGWKYDNFNDGIKNNEFDKGYLVSMFEDYITLSDITKPICIDTKECPKTTEFENNNYVLKTTVHYNQEKILNY